MKGMTYNYDILPDIPLVVEHFSGQVSLDGLIDSLPRLWSEKHYNPAYDRIANLSNASVVLTPHELLELGRFLSQSPRAPQGKIAILTDAPFNTAIGLLFKQIRLVENDVNVFNTWEAACQFLLIDPHVLPAHFRGQRSLALPYP